jgi:hypothetical protein
LENGFILTDTKNKPLTKRRTTKMVKNKFGRKVIGATLSMVMMTPDSMHSL